MRKLEEVFAWKHALFQNEPVNIKLTVYSLLMISQSLEGIPDYGGHIELTRDPIEDVTKPPKPSPKSLPEAGAAPGHVKPQLAEQSTSSKKRKHLEL